MTITTIPTVTSFIVEDVHEFETHATGVLTAVRTDAGEQIHALKVTVARLAKERHEAHQAALDLQLRAERAEKFAERAWAAAEDIAATVVRVVCENERLRATAAELEALRSDVAQFAGTPRRRLRRR